MLINSYKSLYQTRLTQATKPFGARGKLQKRCSKCCVAEYLCMCEWMTERTCDLDIVILFHRNEILKPTNTGRIIAQTFPNSTHCFCWDRTQPDADLLKLLSDPARQPLILYPEDKETTDRDVFESLSIQTDKKLTLIVLDGTWKQARRMMSLSSYLQNVPALNLNMDIDGGYGLRKALNEGQLATAEAVACAIKSFGDDTNALVLHDLFTVFAQHYMASRSCKKIDLTQSHQRLSQL